MERHAQRRAAGRGGFTRSCPTSTCTGWTSSSRQFSSRNTPEGCAGHATRRTDRMRTAIEQARRRGDRAEVRAAAQAAAQPAQRGSAAIPATGGCGTSDTPTITCSGSPDQRPKPSRSRQRLAQFLRDDLKLELSPDKDLDHPRPHRRGAVPRLRDHRPAQRPADHPWPPGGQRR